ncbi:hypothetical protein MMC07_008133 [Pseudocyphellaria aurata]|nr:hypothetical protein [Pseudocyphellaria aurata]
MTNFKIDIVSDTVCPWCYIGKKKLDRAISLYRSLHPASDAQQADSFTITWYPFYLNPSAPTPGVDKRSFYASKFGGPVQAARIFQTLDTAGKSVGINFRFGGLTGNTRDSHRLIQLAGRPVSGAAGGAEMQNRVVDQLFAAYFENEEDITNRDVLCARAVRAGVPEEQVRTWLQDGSDAGGDVVDREVEQARVKGVSGVPNFTLQGKYSIGGAQDPEAFVKLFEKIKEMER